MEFQREHIDRLVDSIYEGSLNYFKNNVFAQFIFKAEIKFKSYNLNSFFSIDVLTDIFDDSTFMDIFESDPNYLFEFSSEYWSQHILNEIEESIDLNMLQELEEEEEIGEINSTEIVKISEGFEFLPIKIDLRSSPNISMSLISYEDEERFSFNSFKVNGDELGNIMNRELSKSIILSHKKEIYDSYNTLENNFLAYVEDVASLDTTKTNELALA